MRLLIAPMLLLASPAAAEITASSADGFTSRSEALIPKPPASVWAALTSWGQWWDPAHSYSGKPGTLSLDAKAGGQLSEQWGDGSVQHATVLSAMPPNGPRRHYMRGILSRNEIGFLQVTPIFETDSSHSASLAMADALIVQPENDPGAPPGEIVDVIPLNWG